MSRSRDARPSWVASWCRSPEEIEAAQQLRYRVFAREMGANLKSGPAGLDVDEFDAWCDHLVVRDACQKVIGTYRVLRPEKAAQLGRLYSETEFDLEPLQALRPHMIEVGRACVDPDHRAGGVIMALWSGLAQLMSSHGYVYMLGCVSVPLREGAPTATDTYRYLSRHDALSERYDVKPLRPFPDDAPASDREVALPSLLKAYLRLGAKVCSAPTHDPAFHTADFLTLLDLQDMRPRYASHFLRGREALSAA